MRYALIMFPTEYSIQPAELGRLAEEKGFDSVWLPEHTHIPLSRKTPWPGGPELPKEYVHTYDPIVALTAMAGATTTLKLATGIILMPQRDPITTAKELATLDNLSNGRVIVGIGGGWNQDELEDHGVEFRQRFPVLRERVLAMQALWTQEEAEFHGKYVNFDASWAYPKPVQQPHPPVVMGGAGATTFDRVIEFCQGWMPICRGGKAPPELKQRIVELKQRAEDAGRDPASIEVSVYAAPRRDDVVEELLEAGADRCIFHIPTDTSEAVRETVEHAASLMK
jgi:probable F420-dependent oxidoreductase